MRTSMADVEHILKGTDFPKRTKLLVMLSNTVLATK